MAFVFLRNKVPRLLTSHAVEDDDVANERNRVVNHETADDILVLDGLTKVSLLSWC